MLNYLPLFSPLFCYLSGNFDFRKGPRVMILIHKSLPIVDKSRIDNLFHLDFFIWLDNVEIIISNFAGLPSFRSCLPHNEKSHNHRQFTFRGTWRFPFARMNKQSLPKTRSKKHTRKHFASLWLEMINLYNFSSVISVWTPVIYSIVVLSRQIFRASNNYWSNRNSNLVREGGSSNDNQTNLPLEPTFFLQLE
jgi:hypothetical protein